MTSKKEIILLKNLPSFLSRLFRINQTALASYIGISRATLSNWANGNSKKIDNNSIFKIADILKNKSIALGLIEQDKIEIIWMEQLEETKNKIKNYEQEKIILKAEMYYLKKEIVQLREKIYMYELNKENIQLKEKLSSFENQK